MNTPTDITPEDIVKSPAVLAHVLDAYKGQGDPEAEDLIESVLAGDMSQVEDLIEMLEREATFRAENGRPTLAEAYI